MYVQFTSWDQRNKKKKKKKKKRKEHHFVLCLQIYQRHFSFYYTNLLAIFWEGFECLLQELLIAKFPASDVSQICSKLKQNYFSDKNKELKKNFFWSLKHDILSCVPQGSILGPLLFDIFLWGLFPNSKC